MGLLRMSQAHPVLIIFADNIEDWTQSASGQYKFPIGRAGGPVITCDGT